jgi:hypothetical protein
MWKKWQIFFKGEKEDDDEYTEQNSTSMNVVTGWLTDYLTVLTDWLNTSQEWRKIVHKKEIVSYFEFYKESLLVPRLFFKTYFQFFETNRNQRIVSPRYLKKS